MANKSKDKTDDLTNVLASLIVVKGAGKRAKTSFARMYLEAWKIAGAPIKACDLEDVNPGLATVMPCIRPNSPIDNGAQLAEFLLPMIKEIAATRESLLIDFEGSDDRLIDMAKKMPLLQLMRGYGVPLIVIAVVGGGTDDLVTIDALGQALEGPADVLIVVVNEALLPHVYKHRETYEIHIGKQPGVKMLGGKRVVFVWMPPCPLMRLMDGKNLRFETIEKDYIQTGSGIDDWQAAILGRHFRTMLELMSWIVPCRN